MQGIKSLTTKFLLLILSMRKSNKSIVLKAGII